MRIRASAVVGTASENATAPRMGIAHGRMAGLPGLLPHTINCRLAARFHYTTESSNFRHHHDAVAQIKAPGVADAGRFDRLWTGLSPDAAQSAIRPPAG